MDKKLYLLKKILNYYTPTLRAKENNRSLLITTTGIPDPIGLLLPAGLARQVQELCLLDESGLYAKSIIYKLKSINCNYYHDELLSYGIPYLSNLQVIHDEDSFWNFSYNTSEFNYLKFTNIGFSYIKYIKTLL